jgi:uncharacterized protein (DUF1697 family)
VTNRWIAFLRAINVGNRRVTGDRLVGIFESHGFEDVTSYQASGNVLFSAEAPDRVDLERALRDSLGYDVPTVLRSGSCVRDTSSAMPFERAELDATERRIQVILLRDPTPLEALRAACSSAPDDDLLRPHGSDIFWLPRAGITGSALDLGALERELGPVTVRTHGTIRRLVDRL